MTVHFSPDSSVESPHQRSPSSFSLPTQSPSTHAPEVNDLLTLLNDSLYFIRTGQKEAAVTFWGENLPSLLQGISQSWNGLLIEFQKIATQKNPLANQHRLRDIQNRSTEAAAGVKYLLDRLELSSNQLTEGVILQGAGIDSIPDLIIELKNILNITTCMNQMILSLLPSPAQQFLSSFIHQLPHASNALRDLKTEMKDSRETAEKALGLIGELERTLKHLLSSS